MILRKDGDRNRGMVALVLSIGLVVSFNLFTFAMVWDAVFHNAGMTVDENSTQVLTGAFTGIVGVLGAYIGFRAGHESGLRDCDEKEDPADSL